MKFFFALSLATCLVSVSATTVAVLELGRGGTVHKVTASSPTSSTNGVLSFLQTVHDASHDGNQRKTRATQYPGMNVVPDIFSRPNGGVVIGIYGEGTNNLQDMPTVASFLSEESSSKGYFHVEGDESRRLMRSINASPVKVAEFGETLSAKSRDALQTTANKIESVAINVASSEEAGLVDAHINRMLVDLADQANEAGATILVHLVVDDQRTSSRRRLAEEDNGEDGSSYEIPGYYDDNGNFITPYRTIFQIQYYNICLWTAIGLFTIFVSANLITVNMPLMPDTLLFGESAKMVAE
jgi:hypothetical protein